MNNKKILIISTQISGGCFHYSNQIIKHLHNAKEVVLSQRTIEKAEIQANWHIKYYGYSHLSKLISLIFCLMRIFLNGIRDKYSGLLLFGITKWDLYILKLWKILHLPSYLVIHDGKMHTGEENIHFQQQIIDMMHCATHLVFLSEYVKNLVKDNFGISKPSCIVPHGLIDYGKLPAVQKQSEKPTLLFLGRVSKYKGVELLLDAISKVPEELYDKLIIAGKWNYQNTENYNHDKIDIIDKWLSNDEILLYMAISDIMIFPYTEASQSGVATLAINYLKPSIVTEVGALSEQFDEKSAFFIRPDSEDLAKAIIYLSEHPYNLKTMKKELQKLKTTYSWENIGNKLSSYILKTSFQ